MQIVAFGIGLMVLLLLTFVRTQLMVEWQTTLQETAPNQFLINIQPSEIDDIETFLRESGLEPSPNILSNAMRGFTSVGKGVSGADQETELV